MLPKKLYTQGSDESDQNVVSFITGDFSNDGSELDESVLLETIPILPLRNTIVFPGSGLPISVGRAIDESGSFSRKKIDISAGMPKRTLT
jgi:ATP-dependent Lon protease